MKTYFCGSIRGGREFAETYRDMIGVIKQYGPVLTEHVGHVDLKEARDDRGIWEQDTGWLRESDIVIAECSCPSIGVGYELAYAESRGIPVHVFFRKDRGLLSAMISGDSYFTVHVYERPEELPVMIREIYEK